MKSSEKALALGMIAAVSAALIAGTFAYRQQSLETESRTRAEASELRVRQLESQSAELQSQLRTAKQRGDIQGQELTALRHRNAELEKQVVELTSRIQPASRGKPIAVHQDWGFEVPPGVEPGTPEFSRLQNEDLIRRQKVFRKWFPDGPDIGTFYDNGKLIKIIDMKPGERNLMDYILEADRLELESKKKTEKTDQNF